MGFEPQIDSSMANGPVPRLAVALARTAADIEDALRLRYKVFAEEMRAVVRGPDGLDQDDFDAWCDHLIVRDVDTQRVVGTYRILPSSPTCRR